MGVGIVLAGGVIMGSVLDFGDALITARAVAQDGETDRPTHRVPGILTAPKVVAALELPRYVGRWYEIESTKPSFQKGCTCVTADYQPQGPRAVKVINTCLRDGVVDRTVGTAEAGLTSSPAKLRVSFPGFGSFISNFFLRTNYWVVDLDPDYGWAVVSTRLRTPIWILAREPRLAPEVIDGIKHRLAAEGFDAEALTHTPQEGCTWPEP